jgi:hypothetical protein
MIPSLPSRAVSVAGLSPLDFLRLLTQKHLEGGWFGVEAEVHDLGSFSLCLDM